MGIARLAHRRLLSPDTIFWPVLIIWPVLLHTVLLQDRQHLHHISLRIASGEWHVAASRDGA
ncbi:MAG: hypothetical protein B7Z40_01950 [Bosea sp. 12-68-7]|nr:MAG: hypothetical protein B7Z40_01950 [Bosea sp. 12-68-7]